MAEKNEKIMGITPAMPSGSSLNIMMDKMPDRAFDVGICEQHAVTFSAGLATQGMVPFCNIYSSFMQRAYDQVIHDVALQKLPVVFCLDRAGLVGADGATHHGAYDISYMRCIPNMVVAAPMNEQELRNLMYSAQKQANTPWTIRYPRGKGVMPEWKTPFEEIQRGKGREVRNGSGVAFVTFGTVGNFALEAADQLELAGINPGIYDMRFAKPLDEALLHTIFDQYDDIVTVEDGCLMGGFGSAILEFASENGYRHRIKRLGIPDRFVEHGTQPQLYEECGYDVPAILKAVREIVGVETHV